jgi:Protein of unknown function (DUF4054)
MGVTVSLSFATWQGVYPEFASVTQTQYNTYYAFAQVFVVNDGTGPVRDASLQQALLEMATAHVAQLSGALTPAGQASSSAPALVGRISQAAEGSVNVTSEMEVAPGTAQWWNQTPYGAMVWVALAPFRTMRYIPGRGARGPVFVNGWRM